MTDTQTDTYEPKRSVMTAAELVGHQVDSYGRDYSESDDGYSDMEAEAHRGWTPIAAWGRDGWDLGTWPYVVIYTTIIDGADSLKYATTDDYGILSICEGDRTRYHFKTREDRNAALDYLFAWYAMANGQREDQRAALDEGTLAIPLEYRGPYRTCQG